MSLEYMDEKLHDPNNHLTDEEKELVKQTVDPDSAVKTSLIQLLMSDFSKLQSYDALTKTVLSKLSEEVDRGIDVDTLIELLKTLHTASDDKTQSIYALFKKQGSDLERILEELKELEGGFNEDSRSNKKTKLSSEKKETILKVIQSMTTQKDG